MTPESPPGDEPVAAVSTSTADVVVLSNRGPLSFAQGPGGELQVKRGAGGLVVTLGPGVQRDKALWVASTLSDADRQAAASGTVEAEGFHLRLQQIEPPEYRAYY
ncbi:MAG: hypothetical protein ACR2NJ_06460, partial [Acidimicrobiales bacterium]